MTIISNYHHTMSTIITFNIRHNRETIIQCLWYIYKVYFFTFK